MMLIGTELRDGETKSCAVAQSGMSKSVSGFAPASRSKSLETITMILDQFDPKSS
jgi:hypothetical protein